MLSKLRSNVQKSKSIQIITFILLWGVFEIAFSENFSSTQAKTKLKELEQQINQVQTTLTQNEKQRDSNQRALHNIEKKIMESQKQLHEIQRSITDTETEIHDLEQKQNVLRNKVIQEQNTLAKYLRARQKMREPKPLMRLVNPSHQQKFDKLQTFYHYLVHSQHTILLELKNTEQQLADTAAKLQVALQEKQDLNQQLKNKQLQYERDKKIRIELENRLKKDIKKQKEDLDIFLVNKNNLTSLLKNLTALSVLQTKHPLSAMRKKLSYPVQVKNHRIKKMNQGLLFFAQTGTPVHVIYPGKIVFSDWLNGYGLLIIVDHGWGFMSLYANNHSLIKQKGESVNEQDTIATVGHSGEFKKNGLYFELRHRGKVMPPQEWFVN